jgi:serine/threonine protein phosphatase PrpC
MIKLEAASLTDTGRHRDINEDRVWSQTYIASEGEQVGLFIVCDGIGGSLGGEVASHWAVEAVKSGLGEWFCPPDPRATVHLSEAEVDAAMRGTEVTRASNLRKLESAVRAAVQKANKVVFDYAKRKPQEAGDAGTTISMALAVGDRVVIANVGDSRTYLLRDKQLQQVTQDHSLVATLVASGQMKPDEIYTHPQRNLIYRSLGHKKDVQVDTYVKVLEPGDHLLLCSDGLWEMVQDEKLMARLILESSGPEQACHKLVDTANLAGGEDNIGVVVVKVSGERSAS